MLSEEIANGVSPTDLLAIKRHLTREGTERELVRHAKKLRLQSLGTFVTRLRRPRVHPSADDAADEGGPSAALPGASGEGPVEVHVRPRDAHLVEEDARPD